MSYCNFDTSGCAAGTQNLLQFDSTQIDFVLRPAIASVVSGQPGCLNSTDDIFFSDFDRSL